MVEMCEQLKTLTSVSPGRQPSSEGGSDSKRAKVDVRLPKRLIRNQHVANSAGPSKPQGWLETDFTLDPRSSRSEATYPTVCWFFVALSVDQLGLQEV